MAGKQGQQAYILEGTKFQAKATTGAEEGVLGVAERLGQLTSQPRQKQQKQGQKHKPVDDSALWSLIPPEGFQIRSAQSDPHLGFLISKLRGKTYSLSSFSFQSSLDILAAPTAI